jgi:GNAT superfamily N-acetyltransferase
MGGVHRAAELDDEQTELAFPAMDERRPPLAGAAELVERVRRQHAEGHRLAASFDADTAVAGFPRGKNLALGRNPHVDDLSTLPSARGRGQASAPLRRLDEEAVRLGREHVHRARGTHRHDARRRYPSSGHIIPAPHLSKVVT